MAKTKNGKKNPRGIKKADKIHGMKKGKKGEAAAYMTRAQALAKLQLPLADFRKLCILKGVYPRDPKKKPGGNDKTYYHGKDIAFLMHEPLIKKFFELKTFMKKFKRLMGRDEKGLAKSLEGRKPEYTLSHLVRERYPTFEDALRDLDDAVSMLALFNSLSADQTRDIPADDVNEARALYEEFQLYIIRSQSLRKTFASIKGYYFQAEIHGQTVTWLAPHQFAQDLPEEVDFRVMLSFLEFYRAVVKFVNFKLYADVGMAYPPKRIEKKDTSGAEVAALEVEMKEAGKQRETAEAKDGDEDAAMAAEVAKDFGEQDEEALALQQQVAQASRMKTTFRGLKVFISREVPLRPIYFALLCGGATAVGWEKGSKGQKNVAGSAFDMKFKHVTHQVVDRPPEGFEQIEGREYVQPQWVFDSFNTGCLLPVAPYAPGRAPPPHLSPFVDDKAEGYVPRQREILDRHAAESAGVAVTTSTSADGETANPAAVARHTAADEYKKGLQAEAKGIWHSDHKEEEKAKQKTEEAEQEDEDMDEEEEEEPMKPTGFKGEKLEEKVKPTEDEEELMRRKALMPKKHKRLLQRIDYTKNKKADQNSALLSKRKKSEGK